MQELETTLPIGHVIRERYIIEDLLGKGGFSAVYLVRDGRVKQNLYALKEVIDPEKKDRTRFLFEGELLRRLEHRALPRVYRAFEDEAQRRAYMLMDYIEGPNLEMLRNEQPEKRFSLPQVLSIMAPIMDAVGYLHRQNPPIIHRDIKPSNIISPISGEEAALVDFGIAKEFNPESTTTAVRHCTPGYGAPEQYRLGTTTRTDIYGLGATLYTLLTGVTPADALYRMTNLGIGEDDPLEPINKQVPALAQHIAIAIHRALAINSNDRFATVEEFWQALNARSIQQLLTAPIVDPATSPTQPKIAIVSKRPATVQRQIAKVTSAPTVHIKALPRKRRSRIRFVLLILILLALLTSAGIGAGTWLYNASHPASHSIAKTLKPGPYPTVTVQTSPSTHPTTVPTRPSKSTPGPTTTPGQVIGANPTPTSIPTRIPTSIPTSTPTSLPTKEPGSTPTPHPTPSPTSTPAPTPTPYVYPNVAGNYNGTIDDTTENITTTMALSIQQASGQGSISGTFTVGPHLLGSGNFTGSVTTAKYIQFTVAPYKKNAPLYFYGWVQSDGSLKGQYCSINAQKQCDAAAGDAGTWNVGPPASGSSVLQTSIQKALNGWSGAIAIILEWGGAIFFLLVALLLMIYSLQGTRFLRHKNIGKRAQ